jgi:DNA-binding NarL/FixJ family response regulator
VARQAAPDEILVSSTVKDLVAGAGLRFADRGTRALAGAADEWRLFAVLAEGINDAPGTPQTGLASPALLLPDLTRRECEVLPLVAQGCSNRQIADTLCIGERTVESHVARILAKRGLTSRAHLAAAAAAADHRADGPTPR